MDLKFNWLLLVVFFGSLIGNANTMQFTLVAKDGTNMSCKLKSQPIIKIKEEQLILIDNGNEYNFNINQLHKIEYQSGHSGIVSSQKQESTHDLMIKDGVIIASSYENDNVMIIYHINGQVILSEKIQKGTTLNFPIMNLEAGVYIINFSGITYKYIKK